MPDPSSSAVLVVGAGTMGAGIAQVAAVAGWDVFLSDLDEATAARAITEIRRRLDRLVEKGRMKGPERDAAAARLRPVASAAAAAPGCSLVIEAVVEDLAVKTRVLAPVLAALPPDAIVATNTSSLSVSDLGTALRAPARVVGMHFFNPAPLLPLVEVVAGEATDPAAADRVAAIAESWGKKVARARDVPGFIVNHVARPYYLEAFRILEDRHATVLDVDDSMKTLGRFRMGPLELTDLIGQDINTATTRSVWERLGHPPLLAPSRLQEELVARGDLGRKTGRGVYDHGTDPAAPAIRIDLRDPGLSPGTRAAIRRFCRGAIGAERDDRAAYVFARILVALIAQATEARARGVARTADIDLALRYGTNYPEGPFAWAARIGADACVDLVEHLNRDVADARFPVPSALAAPAEADGAARL